MTDEITVHDDCRHIVLDEVDAGLVRMMEADPDVAWYAEAVMIFRRLRKQRLEPETAD